MVDQGSKGRGLLFLIPEELGFLRYLKEARVPLNEYEFPKAKVANVQSQLERLVEKNYYLHQSARDAYRAYILAYNSHQLKDIFNVHSLDLQARTPCAPCDAGPSLFRLVAPLRNQFCNKLDRADGRG